MVQRCLRLSLLVILSSVLLTAQPAGNWDAVRQLTADQPIRISLSNGHSVEGKFQSATDAEVLLSTSKAQQTVARADITQVATKGSNHRVRHALIGLGVGAGAGLAAGAIVDHADRCAGPNGCFVNILPSIGKEALTPAGALLGLIIGAVIPTGNWHDVYRTK